MASHPHTEMSVNLDMLRALAVMAVFYSHIYRAHHDLGFDSLGSFGVILFFIHTSYVLMASLRRLEKTAMSDTSLTLAFWTRRIFRIYPLAILCVVLTAVFRIPVNPGDAYSWIGVKGFLSNLALIQNLTGCHDIQGPLWSLPIEMQMYVILPFAYFAIRGERRYRSLALWFFSVFSVLTLALLLPASAWDTQRFNLLILAPCFTSGIVAFDLVSHRRWVWKLPAWVWPIGIFTAIALYGPHGEASIPHRLFRAWVLSLLLGVLYANVKEGRPNWIHSVFHWIAERSYGIYLSHSIVLWIVFYKMDQLPLWVQIPALIAGATGIPALLYVTIEKPLIQVGIRIAKRILGSSD